MIVLDGRALAALRAPAIARDATAMLARRGRAPTLLLVAFADAAGRAPHVQGKLRACSAVGVNAVPLVVATGTLPLDAMAAMQRAITTHQPDGVFVQVPFPDDFDGTPLLDAIPVAADVDIMTQARTTDYLTGASDLPPVTVTAALELLDAHAVSVHGLHGVMVAEDSPFTGMFVEALRRRGARMAQALHPDATDLEERVGEAGLVVAAAGRPGLLRADRLAPGAIAIDAGYFNPGGLGDIDVSGGVAHLGALMPVPGGIGPMTVSALVARVVEFGGTACGPGPDQA